MILKYFKKSSKGFTLVELMIAIAIIAILAVVGVTVFQNVQRNARDSRRNADIESIAKALEVRYNDESGAYPAITGDMFAGGVVPLDPSNGSTVANCGGTTVNLCTYCLRTTPPTGAACASSDPIPANFTGGQVFEVCTNLENGGVRCIRNQRS